MHQRSLISVRLLATRCAGQAPRPMRQPGAGGSGCARFGLGKLALLSGREN